METRLNLHSSKYEDGICTFAGCECLLWAKVSRDDGEGAHPIKAHCRAAENPGQVLGR